MYNLNINGSRALAAILVFLFHLNFNLFSGGYIGVDIFFVISGYVVSNSLIKQFNNINGYKAITSFYLRRLLRILPALLVLSLILIIVLNFIFINNHYLEFLNSISFSNIFVSNFYFWNQSGYFGLENSFKPLLHTWSLSVEGQIYLLFPIIGFLIYKKKYLLSFSIFLLFSIFSIVFAELFIDRPFVYFFPFLDFMNFC